MSNNQSGMDSNDAAALMHQIELGGNYLMVKPQDYQALTRERDELRAEVARLKKAHAEAEQWIEQNLATVGDLEAEVERLQRERGVQARVYGEKQAEAERLKAAVVEIGAAHVAAQAEVERLKIREETAKAAIAGSEKEIERLRTGWNECQRYMTLSLEREDALRAEAERLRPALEGYVTGCHACMGVPVIVRPLGHYPPTYECRECAPAREALDRSNC